MREKSQTWGKKCYTQRKLIGESEAKNPSGAADTEEKKHLIILEGGVLRDQLREPTGDNKKDILTLAFENCEGGPEEKVQ